MAVEYEIASDIAVISEVANTNQLAHVAKFYTGAVTYDDEASSKFATVTIDGKSQRVMLCIAVNGTVNYDDVPCKYSTVDGHRCLNVVEPNGTETPDDVPSVYETMVVDGKTIRAIRCVLINQTPIYDGVSSVCTFVDSGKTHTAQLVNVVGSGAIEVIVKGVPPLVLPDAVSAHVVSLKAFGGTIQGVPVGYTRVEYLQSDGDQCFKTDIFGLNTRVVIDAQYTGSSSSSVKMLATYDSNYNGTYFGVYSNKWGLTSSGTIGSATTRSVVECVFTTNSSGYNKATLTVGGETTSFTRTSARPSKILYILGNGSYKFIGKMYSCQIYDNDTNKLLLDGIPAVRNSDSVAGMYDTVSGQFLENIGTGAFSVGSNIVPTPTTPVDISCNNGALKVRDSELPVEYKRIRGMTMNNDCYYRIIGFKMQGSDTLRFSFTRTGSAACNVVGSYDGTNANSNYSLYAGTANSANYLRYNGGTYNSYAIADKKYDVVLTPTGSDGMETDSTWTAKTFTSTTDFCVGTTSPTATSSKMIGRIHGAVIVDGRLKLIPCERISDGEIGYYNTYNETFYEPIGTTPTSLGYDYSSYELYTEGPVETIEIEDDQYATVSTATCENLLSIDDYTDEQNIITGQVTRKIGVKVFNGTEDWISNTTNIYQVGLADSLKPTESPQRIAIYSTHFVGTNAANANMPNNSIKQGNFTSYANNGGIGIKMTGLSGVTAFKQWLVAQCDAGTPVIIAYVLKNNVTEQVTAQSMSTVAGDNTVEITQAGMGGLELEVAYMGGAELTVEEVEDAQLSPDVEVTIQ